MPSPQESLSALRGTAAPNLSPGVIVRLTAGWQDRVLSVRRYVCIWADGVYLQARLEPEAECILVIIGATPDGRKALPGFHLGIRESAQSRRGFLIDIKPIGLAIAPEVVVGDGALGFWKAVDALFPGTRHQRGWFLKISNVLNKFPKSMAPAVTSDLQDIHHAETKAAALAPIGVVTEKYGVKFAAAVACLTKDTEALLTFLDYPAEHGDHLRTSNPVESVFAIAPRAHCRRKPSS